METILHIYHPKRQLLLLEYANRSSSSSTNANANVSSQSLAQNTSTPPTNVLLFVGGMYDVFRSPSYIEDLAALFPRDIHGQKWRVMHVQLSSSGKCFGLYDLDRDVDEISTAITFIRTEITHSPTSPVVLMGHSTGCQDLLHYLISPVKSDRPTISGAIFQAPVSDREALLLDMSTDPATRQSYQTCLSIAESTPPEHHKTTILPLHFSRQCMGPAPLTIARFLSLASPGSPDNPGMDDYFSSDLSDGRLLDTFGRIGSAKHLRSHSTSTSTSSTNKNTKSVIFLPSGSDEHVPPSIDKSLLLARWKHAVETDAQASLSPHSQIVKNGLHDISGESVDARTARLIDMRGSVLRYLHDVVGDVGYGGHDEHSPWAIYERDRSAIEAERAGGGSGGTGSGGSGSGSGSGVRL
ncbi:hypothetical protein ABEF95_010631 [Exophiala dermatitidis]